MWCVSLGKGCVIHKKIVPLPYLFRMPITTFSTYQHIDMAAWEDLLQRTDTATWFQSPAAYRFYVSVPQELMPFAYSVEEDGRLLGVIIGYITPTRGGVRRFFSRRAIILGGALLDKTISDEALGALLTVVRTGLQDKAIYIELRNFNDYSPWRSVFVVHGFDYQPHLNYRIDCTDLPHAMQRMKSNRRRQVRKALRNGAEVAEAASVDEVKELYSLLRRLYRKRIKTPCPSWVFFEGLYRAGAAVFLVVHYRGQVIGGMVCPILLGKTIYEWFVCGLDREYREQYPSVLATYGAMVYANRHGLPLFDMMGAGVPQQPYGVRAFKARFGGTELEYGRFCCVCRPLLYHIGKSAIDLGKFVNL